MTTELAATPSEDLLHFIARPTPQLRAALGRFELMLPPADFAGLLANIRSTFGKYTVKLLEFRPGHERGSALHQMMDKENRAASGVAISCHEGCSGCCHYEVEITQDEAEILKAIVQEGFPIDRERLAEQASRERMSTEWSRFWSPKNRCVFLGETGGCQVYDERPATCRKHLVTTPASACTTAGAAVAPVQVLMAEILLSAALSIEGTTFASLPKMLHTALESDRFPRIPDASTGRPVARGLPAGRPILEIFDARLAQAREV
jgi:hypothetical protein